ncbi:MAG TPA: ABC transporter ATP-binding protein [Thermomicrobiales bacterium]|nr:ABC transporter ATP-binding protein [Thermomicrobiales bacterium]
MDVVDVAHLAKTYEGLERSLRGTKLEWRGPALWLRNLARGLRLTSNPAPPVTALRDVSLTLAAGEVFGLVGSNGSGKTTLIKILAGLIRPSAGAGVVAGVPLDRTQAIRQRVSYVSTTGWMGLEWPLTAEENVRLFADLCGLPRPLARERAAAALREVGLWPDRHKYSGQLSNGMRQRVILARALLLRTPLVLLDEPTVGLDPVVTDALLGLIRDTLRARGQAVLITDHQSAELEAVADRVGILRDGRLVRVGRPRDLLAPLAHLTVVEVQTEEMDRPPGPPPPAVVAAHQADRPGALGVRAWRVYARRSPAALQAVLDWIEQPAGRVALLAERAPTLEDLLLLPEAGPGPADPPGTDAADQARMVAR